MNMEAGPKDDQQPFSVKTQEIQIQENCVDDDNEDMKTPQQVMSAQSLVSVTRSNGESEKCQATEQTTSENDTVHELEESPI